MRAKKSQNGVMTRHIKSLTCILFALLLPSAQSADQPQWGMRHTRNLISAETGIPTTFNPETGQNIKWSADLGDNTYGTPIVSGGKVLIATNNGNPRDPKHQGDRGVLMCFDEDDGSFLWQLVIPKIADYQDWPRIGLTTVPTVEGDRIYLLSNRCEVLCVDLNGLRDGNDGPFTDEGTYMSPGNDSLPLDETDGDILWRIDLIEELGVHPHDAPFGSVMVKDRYLYVCTSNGVDASHRFMPAPEAPSLVVVDKETRRGAGWQRPGLLRVGTRGWAHRLTRTTLFHDEPPALRGRFTVTVTAGEEAAGDGAAGDGRLGRRDGHAGHHRGGGPGVRAFGGAPRGLHARSRRGGVRRESRGDPRPGPDGGRRAHRRSTRASTPASTTTAT